MPKLGPRARVSRVSGNKVGLVAIDAELLKILVCPACKTPVTLTSDEQGLRCGTCKRVYPIKDDIPIMLVDEARVES